MSSNSGEHLVTSLPSGEWQVVTGDSKLGFATRVAVMPVRGRYSDFAGELGVDQGGRARGQLTVVASSLKTGIGKRDQHLCSDEFFDTERFELVTFDLESLTPGAENLMRMTGTLTIRNHRQPVDSVVSVMQLDERRLQIAGNLEVDHRAAGFAARRLPRRVRLLATIVLTRAPAIP